MPLRNIPNFVSNRFTDNKTSLLLSTAEFLRFNVDRADTVFVPGHVNVRYCPGRLSSLLPSPQKQHFQMPKALWPVPTLSVCMHWCLVRRLADQWSSNSCCCKARCPLAREHLQAADQEGNGEGATLHRGTWTNNDTLHRGTYTNNDTLHKRTYTNNDVALRDCQHC